MTLAQIDGLHSAILTSALTSGTLIAYVISAKKIGEGSELSHINIKTSEQKGTIFFKLILDVLDLLTVKVI